MRLSQLKLKHPKPKIIDGKKKVYNIKVIGSFFLEPRFTSTLAEPNVLINYIDIDFCEVLSVVSRAQLKKLLAIKLVKLAEEKSGRNDCWTSDIRFVHFDEPPIMADQEQIKDLYLKIKEEI